MHAAATTFLEEFGNLRVRFSHPHAPELFDDFHFDPVAAAAEVEPARVLEAYVQQVSEALCVVGACHLDHMILAMAPSGRVYGGYDDVLVFVGQSGEAAIENLCSGKKQEPASKTRIG